MTIKFKDINISSCNLVIPISGPHSAEVVFKGPFAPNVGTTAKLQIDDIELTMTVVTKEIVALDNSTCRLLAGNGTMNDLVDAIHLSDTDNAGAFDKIIKSSENKGSEISGWSSQGLQHFTMSPGTTKAVTLHTLVGRDTGLSWYMDKDGKIIIDNTRQPQDYSEGTLIQNDNYIETRHISKVTNNSISVGGHIVIDISKGKRTWSRRPKSAIKLHKETLDPLDGRFNSNYLCTIDNQNSDGVDGVLAGTLDIVSDDKRLPSAGLKKIPIRCGSGLNFNVTNGDQCILSYVDGDPKQPYISGFVVSSSDNLHVIGTPGDAQFVALSNKVDAEIQRIWNLLTTWTVAAPDGGAALQTAAKLEVLNVESVAATLLKTK